MHLKSVGEHVMDSYVSGWGPIVQSCENNKPSGNIGGRKFYDRLSDYLLHKKESAP
jgi:hypothetical protein